jgi:anion-transporting  ArsA/GET3 family ATPase
MAAEKLYDLVGNTDYDLVVLDTPPVKNALDFLEAPGRLSRFFDKRIIHWFLTPYNERRIFSTLKMGTSAVIFRLLSYVFGREFLNQLSEFLLLFKDMYSVFQSRHETVLRIFKSDSTSFVTVCAPNAPSTEVALYFAEELRAQGYPRGGVVVNQVTMCGADSQDARALLGAAVETLGADLPAGARTSVIARLGVAHVRFRELSAIQRARIAEIRSAMRAGDGFVVEVPRFEQEVNDLRGLEEMADALFGAGSSEKNVSSTTTPGS